METQVIDTAVWLCKFMVSSFFFILCISIQSVLPRKETYSTSCFSQERPWFTYWKTRKIGLFSDSDRKSKLVSTSYHKWTKKGKQASYPLYNMWIMWIMWNIRKKCWKFLKKIVVICGNIRTLRYVFFLVQEKVIKKYPQWIQTRKCW